MTPNKALAALLADRGDTQLALADHAGVSPQHISDILSGKRALTADLARRLPDPYRRTGLKALAADLTAEAQRLKAETR